MYSVNEVIIVEGKYDKHAVSSVVDATVIETKGFGIFSDKEKASLLRKLAEKRGVIILTDSDSGGFLIRNHLKNILKGCDIKHAYIPDIYGKERRKTQKSKEGKLGVEGVGADAIADALKKCGAIVTESENPAAPKGGITKVDLFKAGLSGGEGSKEKRAALMKKLDLPERLTSNALLDVLNVLYTREQFLSFIE